VKYLPDSNVWITLMRNKNSQVYSRLASHSDADILMSSVVVAELYTGACKSKRVADNINLVEMLIEKYGVIEFGIKEAKAYGSIRADLELRGQMIGPYDVQIAATALHHYLTLVTHNVDEFKRIPNLLIEDWQI
jgi:tRNA(fMet)-specific endonuclease VapC